MASLRVLCGIAALGVGILGGMLLYRSPSGRNETSSYGANTYGLQRDAALEVFTRQIADHPEDYMLYLRRGLTLQGMGRQEEALTDLTDALRLSPPVLTAEELGDRANNLALPETHRWTLARELHRQRAVALEALGRPSDALADLDAAVALNTKDTDVLERRGIVRTYTGRIKDAIDDFNAVLNRLPIPTAVVGRANAKYLGGDYAGAAEDFTRAISMSPDKGLYAVWLLKSQLRGRLAIPLKQFEDLPKDNPAWIGINALLADDTPAQMAASLAAGTAKDKALACDGMVFLGEWLVIKTDGRNAPAAFKDAISACRPGTMPHAVATLELRRLATAANAPAATPAPKAPAIMRETPAATGVSPGI
ncbi:MAG: tetratricopeptide repeat protein [Rhodospirillaceae bacterium]|nr:tetratricopeptide repeat protein [Rhodospirillaceae bacterium]